MTQKKNDTQTTAQDLKDHGKKDIIPENEEYYTLDLQRDFDGLNDDDETTVDIIGDNPLDDDETAEVVDNENENEGIDEDNKDGAEVGEPGHWGVDEDTD